jgi:NAD(P)-dependent dehydrogenase (short-subunit alcohol dehydrogenase family)
MAAIVEENFRTCSTRHEEVIQVNYLATFFLTILMLPLCKAKAPLGSSPSRLTKVSSGMVLYAKLPNQDRRPLLASFNVLEVQPWAQLSDIGHLTCVGHLFFLRML